MSSVVKQCCHSLPYMTTSIHITLAFKFVPRFLRKFHPDNENDSFISPLTHFGDVLRPPIYHLSNQAKCLWSCQFCLYICSFLYSNCFFSNAKKITAKYGCFPASPQVFSYDIVVYQRGGTAKVATLLLCGTQKHMLARPFCRAFFSCGAFSIHFDFIVGKLIGVSTSPVISFEYCRCQAMLQTMCCPLQVE